MKRFQPLLGIAMAAASVVVFSFLPGRADRPSHYRPGDWVSYGISNYVSSVAVGPREAYFGTTTGVLRFDILRGRWSAPYTTSDGLAGNQVTAVGYDRNSGFLWCATERGVSRQHPASLQWTNFSKDEIGISPLDEVVSLGFDSEFNWIETRTQLFRQDKFSTIFVPADSDPPAYNNIEWFGLRRDPKPNPLPHFFMPGGYLFDPGGRISGQRLYRAFGAVQDNRLRRAYITSAINDDWGNMWLGTWGLGAMRADLNADQAELLRFGLANQRVDALLFDGSGLWIGGLNPEIADPRDESLRGITFWSNPDGGGSSNNDWRYFDARHNLEISSDEVHNFALHQRKIYAATEYGIVIYDPQRDRWRRLLPTDGIADDRVNDVVAHEGFLYAATDLGLNRLEIASIGGDSLKITEVAPQELRHVRIYDLELQQNLLWAATERGAFIHDMRREQGGYLADNEGPRDEATFSISFADSVVWIGTAYGLDAFDVVHKEWLPAPARRRFPEGQINCVKAGPDVVWVGTDAGAFKYHRQRKDWRQYTTADGLLDNHVNTVLLSDDLVWFGTDLGLTAFRWRAFHNVE